MSDNQATETDHLQGWVNWNENGFWECNVYSEDDPVTPTWFCTGKKGGEPAEVAEKAFEEFGPELSVILDCGPDEIADDSTI